MRNSRLTVLGLVVMIAAAFVYCATAQNTASASQSKPVIVELFTSEGCSSCPPADVLLQKLEADQPVQGAEIIGLEEHVDYWNHDGWFDPYSSPEWTERQQAYTLLIKKDAYTPELVVDGRYQFLGSDPREAFVEISEAVHAEKTEVSIAPANQDAKNERFHVSVGKLAGDSGGDTAEVWLAVTEDGLHSSVSRGENAGRQLNHIATLRSLHKIGTASDKSSQFSYTGDPVVKFNSHWNRDNVHVTVFVQEKKSRQIIGAASTRIKS